MHKLEIIFLRYLNKKIFVNDHKKILSNIQFLLRANLGIGPKLMSSAEAISWTMYKAVSSLTCKGGYAG